MGAQRLQHPSAISTMTVPLHGKDTCILRAGSIRTTPLSVHKSAHKRLLESYLRGLQDHNTFTSTLDDSYKIVFMEVIV